MSIACTSFVPEGRLGNWLFKLAATIGYARKHGLEYTVPTTSRDAFWCPTYSQHLVHPHYDPSLETIILKENGFPYQELPFKEEWRDKNILLDGYFQSSKYFADFKAAVLKSFEFPWELRAGTCAIHVRLGDARRYPYKHYLLSKEYYEEQMLKFPGFKFHFYSDEIQWCVENFGGRKDCVFTRGRVWHHPDQREEVLDLIDASCCENLIASASTFAIWIGILNRNPNKRCIAPLQWLVEGWSGTTADDWRDIIPTGPAWERA